MYDKKHHYVRERFYRDWSYHGMHPRGTVRDHLGYNLECAWFLLRMYGLTKNRTYFGHAKEMIKYCIRYGWDVQNSGFYGFAYRNKVLANTDKIWWVQCEGALSLLQLYRLTRNSVCYDYFRKTTDFCFRHLFDHPHGEWFHSCYEDGTS